MTKERKISVFFGLQPNSKNYEDTDVIIVDKNGLNHLPGGKGEEGETIEETGLRELGEELTGWNKQTIKSAFAYHSHTTNILNVEGIPDEWEQHFISAYIDYSELKPGNHEVKSFKNISVIELCKDWRKNSFALNAYLLLCWRNIIMRQHSKKQWLKYESDVKRGINPYNSDKNKSILITGHSGSGKTTLIDKIRETGFSRMLRFVTDLDFYGYRNSNNKWIVPVKVVRSLIESADVTIAGGTCDNIIEVAKEFDVVIWLEPNLTDDMINNIRKREEERNKRAGHIPGETVEIKLSKLKRGVKDIFFKEFQAAHSNIIVMNAEDALNYVKPYLN